jgi:hypothetical protein
MKNENKINSSQNIFPIQPVALNTITLTPNTNQNPHWKLCITMETKHQLIVESFTNQL